MPYPTVAQAEVYKSRTIQTQIRAAVELDYPVFSGSFHDDFNGAGLPDATKWFISNPSWGLCTQWVGALWVGSAAPGICPSWVQSRHNLAFPIRRDTDWVFQMRAAAAVHTGFGAFVRICGRSFRDAEAIWAVKANTADGLEVHCPDGYGADAVLWANGADVGFNRYRVRYDASAALYIIDIDADDDGTYEIGPFNVPVNGRYAEAIVIGNSTAIQGDLGAWTEWHVDWVDVQGVAEAVEDPPWAAPFTYDGTRFSYLPTLVGGQVSCDKDNVVDAASLELDNFGIGDDAEEFPRLYTNTRFLNRRAIIEGRAGDGDGAWTPWEVLFDGICSEKQVSLDEGGKCRLTVPLRDRWRAIADDMEILACYSDAGMAIAGVGMNLSVAEIIEDIYRQKCGLAVATHNVQATPNNTPRNYNVFRQSAQGAVRTIAEHAALAVWQRRRDARIEVRDWQWGAGVAGYVLNTAEEVRHLRWTESAFDATSAEQLEIENSNMAAGGFVGMWPPYKTPFYGRMVHSSAVSVNSWLEMYNGALPAKLWWARNRNLGGLEVVTVGQFWVEHDLLLRVVDNKFLGLGTDQLWCVDGWRISWTEEKAAEVTIRLSNCNPDRFLQQGLPE